MRSRRVRPLATVSGISANHIQSDDGIPGKVRAEEAVKTPKSSLLHQIPAPSSSLVLEKTLDFNRKW
jgi:hypothetical protein